MLDAVDEHDHENALVYASRLLDTDSSNPQAKQIIADSGQLFYYLRAAKSSLLKFTTDNNNSTADPKQLFMRYTKARDYVAKAKAIDPESISVIAFEETLDDAQATLIQILSMSVFETGQAVVDKASSNYKKTQEIVDTAESSRYLATFLPHQSAWGSVNTPIEEIKKDLEPQLDEMDDTGSLILDYKEGSSKGFAKSLLRYIKLVKSTVDTLLVPKGSYGEFSKSAALITRKYNQLENTLKDDIPGSAFDDDVMRNLINEIPDYRISKNSNITKIIAANESLYTL